MEKNRLGGKEEARTKGGNVDRDPQKVSRKQYSLDQNGFVQPVAFGVSLNLNLRDVILICR